MRKLLCLLVYGLLFMSCGKEPSMAPQDPLIVDYNSEKECQEFINDIYSRHTELVTFVNELDAAYLEENDKEEYLLVKEKTYTGDDPLIGRLWKDAYYCLHKVHSLLEMIYTNPILTDSFKEKSAGQLLTIRGHIYLQLSLWYGKAPLVLKVLYIEALEDLSLKESSRDEILNVVIADFEAALFYYVDSEYTYMKREEIQKYLIQAYFLKGEFPKVASLLNNENIYGSSFYVAINSWLSGENEAKVIEQYRSSYSKGECYGGKLLLNVMKYDQTYFSWTDNHLAIFPIPQRALELNSQLVQNPGYN